MYRELEEFVIGVDGCAKCVCAESAAKCDVTKCQENILNKIKSHPAEANQKADEIDDFTNIKNQIVKRYFADYDPAKLKVITDALGCESTDCPQLLSASNIAYNILNVYAKRFIGRNDKINKMVVQSTDTEVVNSSPAPQRVISVPYFMTLTQYTEVIVKKTSSTHSKGGINIGLYKNVKEVTFTETKESKYSETNTTTILFPSQNITINPLTAMNVTFNFFQFDDINNYSIDLEIGLDSTISHPDVDANSNVVVVKKELGDFLKKHADFLPTLKYPNDSVIKIDAKEDNGQRFLLRNFPTVEQITGYGVDVGYSHAEKA